MKTIIWIFWVSAVSSLLVACGGGSSSGSGGTGQPVANIDKFVGTYTGTVTQRLTFTGGATTGTAPLIVTVQGNGALQTEVLGTVDVAQCEFPPVILSSNPLSYVRSGSCVVVGSAGPCSGESEGSLAFNASGTGMEGTARTSISCPEGDAVATFTFRATR